MFCTGCGAEVAEGSRFCRKCGAPVPEPPAARTDAELEAQAVGGDREAFAELYNRHLERVYDFLRRMLRDADEAADLAQETFIRAMRALSPKERKASFSTWLFTIARSLALKRLKRRRRVAALPRLREEELAIFHQVDPDRLANPEQAAQTQELSGLVWQAAAALNPKEYSLLDLHLRQGLDSSEIAEVLGVSKGNAYTMMSRLRDTFESAVGALLLLQRGRRECEHLDRLLQEQHITVISPAARRIIDRHLAGCATCQEQRRRLVSPTALFGALAAVPIPFGLKPGIAEALMASWAEAGAQAVGAGLKGLLSQPTAKLTSLPTAWKAAIVGGILMGAVGAGLGGWVGLGGALPIVGGGADQKEVNGPPPSQTQELVSALEDLRQAMLKKIDSDVGNTARTFTNVKDYWRSKRWADIFTVPLRILEDTVALLAKAVDLPSLVTDVNNGLNTSESAYQVLTVVMMVQDLQEVGEQLHYGLDGPTYVAAVEDMLEAADAVNPPLEFDAEAYRRVIENHLYGGFQDLPGPVVIPRKSTTIQRDNREFGRGALDVKKDIMRTFNELIADIEADGLPTGFPAQEVIDQLDQLRKDVVRSMGYGTDVDYKTFLLEGDRHVPHEVETTLGAVGEHNRAFGQIAGAVADKLTIEQRVEVLKVLEAAESTALLWSVTYKVPGVKEEIKVAQKATTLSGIMVGSYDRTFYPNAEELFYMLPQEIVLSSLPTELSNLWMIADDTDQYIRYLLGRASTPTATPIPPTPTQIVFQSSREPKGVYVMDADGTDVARIGSIRGHTDAELESRWSPDGLRVAFHKCPDSPGGWAGLYVMNTDGTGLIQLAQRTVPCGTEGDSGGFSWSPDGTRIVFYSEENPAGLYVVNADGGNLKYLTDGRYPDWSPLGDSIAFRRRENTSWRCPIYLVNADGTNLRLLADVLCEGSGYVLGGPRPKWSPDGSMLAFSANEEPSQDEFAPPGEIFVMGADGSGLTNVTNHPADDDSPIWVNCGLPTAGCEAEVRNVAPERLNVREGPGTEDEVIGNLSEGDTVCLLGSPYLEEGYKWWPLHGSGDLEGWAAERDLAEPNGQWLVATGEPCSGAESQATSTAEPSPSPSPTITPSPEPSPSNVAPEVIATIPVGMCPTSVGVNPETNRIYVTNYDSNDVSVIDGATNSVIATIPVGTYPWGLGLNPMTNRVYVSSEDDDNVSVIDGATNTVIDTISVCEPPEGGGVPEGVDVNPDTDRIYVACSAGRTLSVIDGPTNSVLANISLPEAPDGGMLWDVAVNPTTNRVYVASTNDGSVFAIDGPTNTLLATVELGRPEAYGLAVNPVTNRIYVTSAKEVDAPGHYVFAVDGATNKVVATIQVADWPSRVGVNPITDRIYVSNYTVVSVIDGATVTVSATVPLRYNEDGVGVNPNTNRVYVADCSSNTVSVIEDAPGTPLTMPAAAASPTVTAAPSPMPSPMLIGTSTSTPAPAVVPFGECDQQARESLVKWAAEHTCDFPNIIACWFWSDFWWDTYFVDCDSSDGDVWAVGYLQGIGGYGSVVHSPSSGQSWEIQWTSGTFGPNPFAVDFASPTEGWVATDESLLHTPDAGQEWEQIFEVNSPWDFLRDFQVIDPLHLRGRLSDGRVVETQDGGQTWSCSRDDGQTWESYLQ
jgi:RNA polymerase sigma factor (sigma-70 family)